MKICLTNWWVLSRELDYAKEVARIYTAREHCKVREAFREDFLYWTGDHLKYLSFAVISNIRDALVLERSSIEKRSGLRTSTAPGNHIAYIREQV